MLGNSEGAPNRSQPLVPGRKVGSPEKLCGMRPGRPKITFKCAGPGDKRAQPMVGVEK